MADPGAAVRELSSCTTRLQALEEAFAELTQGDLVRWGPGASAEGARVGWEDVAVEFVYAPSFSAVSLLLLWPVLGCVLRAVESDCCGRRLGRGCLHFRQAHLGRHTRLPKQPAAQRWILGSEMLASLLCIVIVALDAAWLENGHPTVQRWLAAVFALRRLVEGLQAEFILSSLLSVTVAVDVFTLPSLVLQSSWLSLGFLRIVSAVVAYERWRKMANVNLTVQALRLKLVTHKLTSMVLRLVCLIYSFAGITFVLETLGELPFQLTAEVDTEMGKLTMFRMVYWVVETLTTVGYGEFTPTTFLSRLSTLFCMIAGILFFTVQISQLQEAVGNQKYGAGQYERHGFYQGHVVLLGGCVNRMDVDLLGGFLDELFSKNSHPWPDIVIMGPDKDKMIQLEDSVEDHFRSRLMSNSPLEGITFLVGSPLRVEDLERCHCGNARMVYILPDTSGEESTATEDKSNILSALSLRSVFPHTRFRLMLLDGQSRTQALDAGVRAHRCFSVDEFRGAMLWESCRCPGWSTMLSNLLTNVASQELTFSRSSWWGLYARGLDLEIYGFLARPSFHGLSITAFACTAFQRNGICIVIAVGERGSVWTLPCEERVQRNTVLFAICSSRSDLHSLEESSGREWTDVLMEAQEKHHIDKITERERAHSKISSKGSPMRRESSEFVGAFLPGSTKESVLDRLQANVTDIRQNADTNPFVLVVSLAHGWKRRSWRHFGKFFEKLRRDFPDGSLRVVILCRSLPEDDLVFDVLGLSNDSGIGLCVGEPTTARDMERAGARECAAIICSSTSVLEDVSQTKTHELRDADVVLAYRVLRGMGQSHKQIVLEFRHPSNLRLLPRLSAQVRRFSEVFEDTSELDAGPLLDLGCCVPSEPLDAKPDFGDLEYAFNEHFASGGIFTPRALGTLMGATYCNPAVLEVVQAFLLLDGGGGAAPARSSTMCQVSARRWANMTYAKAFEKLAGDAGAPAIPLGLHRLFEDNSGAGRGYGETVALGETVPTERRSLLLSDGEVQLDMLDADPTTRVYAPSARYIVTNPEGAEMVRSSDVLLVLGSPEFVSRAGEQGLLLRLSDVSSSPKGGAASRRN